VTSAPLLRPLAADGAVVDASEPHHSFVYDLQLAPGETKDPRGFTPVGVFRRREGSRDVAACDRQRESSLDHPTARGQAGTQDQVVEAGPEEYAAQVVAKPCGP
jgi:hypothetical protein